MTDKQIEREQNNMINKDEKLIEWVDYQINKCSKKIERYQQLGEPYISLAEGICIELEYFKDIKSELNMVCDKFVGANGLIIKTRSKIK